MKMKFVITAALLLAVLKVSQIYASVLHKPEPVCRKTPREVCKQVPRTRYESVIRKECHSVPDTVCTDFKERKCQFTQRPVQESLKPVFMA